MNSISMQMQTMIDHPAKEVFSTAYGSLLEYQRTPSYEESLSPDGAIVVYGMNKRDFTLFPSKDAPVRDENCCSQNLA